MIVNRIVLGTLARICGPFAVVWTVISCPNSLAIDKTDDIDTNRPSFMDSPLVVPQSSVQLENGVLYQHFEHGTNYFDTSETELRVGLTPRTELQMFVPNFVSLQTPGERLSGVSNLNEIGLKRQFKPLFKDLNTALIAGVSVPTGNRFINGSGAQPIIRLPFTKGISKNYAVGGMQSVTVLNGGRDTQYQNFFLVSRAFDARTSIFAEYGGYYTHHAAPSNIFHSGIVRKINRQNQIDLQYGFGLNKASPAAFIGVGYSFRFDHLPSL